MTQWVAAVELLGTFLAGKSNGHVNGKIIHIIERVIFDQTMLDSLLESTTLRVP